MSIGIFLNQENNNFYDYAMFMTGIFVDSPSVHINKFRPYDTINSLPRYKINIFLNRFCYINIEKLQKKIISNQFYCTSTTNNYSMPFISIDTKKFTKNINTTISNYLIGEAKQSLNVDSDCFCNFIGKNHDKPSLKNAVFISFNDKDKNFVSDLIHIHDDKKPVFYNNKTHFVSYKNHVTFMGEKILVQINKNITVFWDDKSQSWKKLRKRSIKC